MEKSLSISRDQTVEKSGRKIQSNDENLRWPASYSCKNTGLRTRSYEGPFHS